MADPLNSTEGQKKRSVAARQALDLAIADPSVPQVYANGFSMGMTNADAFIVLQSFGRPVAVVNLSYTLAKTLSGKLDKMVRDWEEKTGQELQTTDSIEKAMFTDQRSAAKSDGTT